MHSKATRIPFFPLQIVLIPGEIVPLHIFEPRYKQLINHCQEEGITFGIPYVRNGKLAPYGSVVRLKEVVKVHQSGTMDVMIEGLQTFKVLEFEDQMPGKLYSGGAVELLNNAEATLNMDLIKQYEQFMRVVNPEETDALYESDDLYVIATNARLSQEKKYHFISITGQERKETYLINELKLATVIKQQADQIKYNFYLN